MRKDYEKLFTHLEQIDVPNSLFDCIIKAIKQEQELQHTKKLLFAFLFLLAFSLLATPLSGIMVVSQIKDSGILYFLFAAFRDFGAFLAFGQDFILAILEALPLGEIIFFSFSLGICFFTAHLFLHKKRLLLQCLFHNVKLHNLKFI